MTARVAGDRQDLDPLRSLLEALYGQIRVARTELQVEGRAAAFHVGFGPAGLDACDRVVELSYQPRAMTAGLTPG